MTEQNYTLWVVLVPGLAFAAIASYAAAAGCYAISMNCFSIVVPETLVTRAMFFLAAFTPFGGPAYAPLAATALVVLRRDGASALERWLWLAPPVYAALAHASCVVFAYTALPHRRLSPDLRFDAGVVAAGYAYLAVTRLAKPTLVRRPSRWERS